MEPLISDHTARQLPRGPSIQRSSRVWFNDRRKARWVDERISKRLRFGWQRLVVAIVLDSRA
jgi:hypothetical protein